MSDIITRLVLKSDNFEKNLNKAKGSVGTFEKGVTDMATKAGSGLLKVAGAVGIVMTAAEGFNKIMGSSQTLGDEYARTMDGLKGGIDQFFYSIGSGDWTPFMNGLAETIRLAREAYSAMDQLGNTKMSFSYFDAKNQAVVQEQIAILKDKDSTEEQKQAARELLDKTLKDQSEIVDQYKLRSNNAIQAMVKAAIGMDGVDVSAIDVDKVLRLDVSSAGDKQKEELANQFKDFKDEYDRLKAKYTTYETVGSGMNVHTVTTTDTDALRKEIGPVVAKYQDAIQYNAILVKKNDEWLQKLIEISMAAEGAGRNLASMTKAANRASQAGTGGIKTPKKEAPKGSLGYLDKQISDKKKELQVAISDDSRLKIQKELNDLVKEKRSMEVKVEYQIYEEGASLDDMLKKTGKEIKKVVSETDKSRNKMVKEIKLPKTTKQDIKNNGDYADSLSAISNVMGSISQMTNDGASAWLTWSANLMTAIGTAIPAIKQLIDAKKTEALANGIASATETPVVGWLLAGAAVASVIAAFASMPKFADGGFVGGSSFFGDQLIARVNSGEMILNQGQQSNLFNAIDSGCLGGSSDVVVSGEAILRGDTAFIQMSNYMKRTGKRLPK